MTTEDWEKEPTLELKQNALNKQRNKETESKLIKPDLNKPAFKLLPTAKKLIIRNQCPICGKDIKENEFKDTLSKKEYSISGMCQECQDKTFK